LSEYASLAVSSLMLQEALQPHILSAYESNEKKQPTMESEENATSRYPVDDLYTLSVLMSFGDVSVE
jgi:hypothetical protein